MQNFWQNFLSILCTGIVFIMSLLMQLRPKFWTKEGMITGFLKVKKIYFCKIYKYLIIMVNHGRARICAGKRRPSDFRTVKKISNKIDFKAVGTHESNLNLAISQCRFSEKFNANTYSTTHCIFFEKSACLC